jgi:hypothetical protein
MNIKFILDRHQSLIKISNQAVIILEEVKEFENLSCQLSQGNSFFVVSLDSSLEEKETIELLAKVIPSIQFEIY